MSDDDVRRAALVREYQEKQKLRDSLQEDIASLGSTAKGPSPKEAKKKSNCSDILFLEEYATRDRCVVVRPWLEIDVEQKPIDAGTSGLVWASSVVLSQLVADRHRPPARGGTAVEIGAGCGVVALTAKAVGWTTTATDLSEALVDLQRTERGNQDLKGRGGSYTIAPLDWRAEHSLGTFDLVLASDCINNDELYEDLARTTASLCHSATTVLFAQQIRRAEVESKFFNEVAPRYGLRPEMVDISTLETPQLTSTQKEYLYVVRMALERGSDTDEGPPPPPPPPGDDDDDDGVYL